MEKFYWRELDPMWISQAEQLLSQWLCVPSVTVVFEDSQIDDPSIGVIVEAPTDKGITQIEMDWNELGDMGLIIALNFTLFHPNGFALARDPNIGVSPYFLLADDGLWKYDDKTLDEGIEKLRQYNIKVPWLTV